MKPTDPRTMPGQGRLENPHQLADDAIALMDVAGWLTALRPTWTSTPAPRALHDLVVPADHTAVDHALQRARTAARVWFSARPRAGGAMLQWQLARADPEGFQVRVSTLAASSPARDGSDDSAPHPHEDAALASDDAGFRQVYQRTPIMLQSLDRDGNLIAVSDCWLDRLGYRRTEVIGRHRSEFLPRARRSERDEVLAALMRHGRCKDVPGQLVRKDGEMIDVLVSADAELDAHGRLSRARCVLIEVTEQRRAEASYRDIFENATEGVYRSTEDGRLLRANPALARMHGFARGEELLASVRDLAVDWYADPASYQRLRQALASDGRVEDFEAEVYRRATVERIWTSENARAVYDHTGGIAYVEGTVRDITAQYKARLLARRRGEILEMIARDAPLIATLYEVVKAIEQHWGYLTA
ncbi:MAG: PAS domain S-box protein, partial [Halofilum sp. (in: g-proteobacteria)]